MLPSLKTRWSTSSNPNPNPNPNHNHNQNPNPNQVEYIQDSPEQRKYLAEKAGKESAAMPAMELPDGGIIMFPEEVNPMHVNTAALILGGSSCHSLPCLFSARLLAPFVFHAS